MIRNILCMILILSSTPGLVFAEKNETTFFAPRRGDMALGAVLGSPTKLSMKYWLGNSHTMDAGFGVPFDSDVKFSVHGDFHWLFPVQSYSAGSLGFYAGAGARIRAISNKSKSADFGFRFPVGFEFNTRPSSLNFFAEIVPVAVLTPDREFSLDGGIGIRYRFAGRGIAP